MKYINSKLKLDYTYIEKLINNYLQARCYYENRRKTGQDWEDRGFNKQFQDNIDRGVFRHLTAEVLKAYNEPILYEHGRGMPHHAMPRPLENLHKQQHEAADAFRNQSQ
jgi:hypothetical protein